MSRKIYFTVQENTFTGNTLYNVGKYIYRVGNYTLQYCKIHLQCTHVVKYIYSVGKYIYKAPDSPCALAYSYAH